MTLPSIKSLIQIRWKYQTIAVFVSVAILLIMAVSYILLSDNSQYAKIAENDSPSRSSSEQEMTEPIDQPTGDSTEDASELSKQEASDSPSGASNSPKNSNENPQLGSNDALIMSVNPVHLGGYGNKSISINVQAKSGAGISPLKLSMSDNGQINLQTPSWDAPPGQQPPYTATSRTITIQKTCIDCSGSETIMVSESILGLSGYLVVNWAQSPYYTDRGTQVSRINDTGSHVTYRFTFNITPNQYFGTPSIEMQLSHYGACVNNAELYKKFTYTGNNSFSIDCVIDKSKPELRYGSEELYASLNIARSSGEAIYGQINGYSFKLPSGYSQ